MRNRNMKNKLTSIYLMLGMVMLVIGFSYAFFIYNKTGLYTHTITGGKMKVIYDETTGNNITIENAYPRTDKEALTYGLEFEFTVTGYNESEKNVYYAIEIDYGEDVLGKNRFLDTDMKLSLYENDKEVFENEIFYNLDNQDIYYNYFKAGTSSQTPTINNYKLRIWINDNVIISDTLSNNLNDWTDYEWDYLYEKNPYKFDEVYNGDDLYLSDYGMSIYTSDEFANSYANFKINIKADLNYKDVDYLTYDANGGEFTPKKTSLLTNMITMQKPVKEGKGFLGWSSNPNATVPEYLSGDYYAGEGQMLYAIYSDTRNVMSDFSSLGDTVNTITEVYFINDTSENIEAGKLNADSVYDLTLDNQGSVTGCLYGDILYVVSEGTTYLSTGKQLFSDFESVEYIEFFNADTSMVTDMSSMFGGYYVEEDDEWYGRCWSLLELDLSSFNTSKVTDMAHMFDGCLSLTSLDLSNFDTSQVTDMSWMFGYTFGGYFGNILEEINVSNFDTSNVTNMQGMFAYCTELIKIDFSNWDTSQVEDMSEMFVYCSSLSDVDFSYLETDNVITMERMFYSGNRNYRLSLTTLNISNWNTSNVESMYYMFAYCENLEYLNLANWDVSNVTNCYGMFGWCYGLEYLDLSEWQMSSLTNTYQMFVSCESLKTIYANYSWNNGGVTSSDQMFYGCYDLVGAISFNSSKTTIEYANPDTGYFTRKNS